MEVYPKEVTIGGTTYQIVLRKKMRKLFTTGCFDSRRKTIEVALHSTVRKKGTPYGIAYSKEQVATTFWHEVTHAILFDMGHPMWNDEPFVEGFAKRLSNMINTAKF